MSAPVENLLKMGLLALTLMTAAAGQPADPPKVTMAVSLAKSLYIIGEPITATLAIENHSDQPFLHHSMDPYDITVTDEAGRAVYSPHSEIAMYSGIFPETRINPGERKEFKVGLNEYSEARESGVYTVRLKIRPGSNRGWPGYPAEAALSVRLRLPSPQEAADIVAFYWRSHGGFRALSAPAYVKPLKALALAGNFLALDGLARIPDVEATEAILGAFAGAKSRNEIQSVMSRLAERLPGKAPWVGKTPLTGVPSATIWNEDCTIQARGIARRLIALPDVPSEMAAGQLLAAVGDRSDVAVLAQLCLEALQADDGSDQDPFQPQRLRPGTFPLALEALAKRGQADRGDPMKDPVWAFVTLSGARAAKSPPFPGWAELVKHSFASPYADLRSAAISSIPYPPPAEFAAILAAAKQDPAENVRNAALFVTEHRIDITPHLFRGPPVPPQTIQVESGKMATNSDNWQVAFYTSAIAQDPKNADAYDNRGVAKYDLGQFDAAIADFNEALRLRPRLAAAFNNRGMALAAKAQPGKAILDYNRALELDSKMTEAIFNRGMAYAQQEDYAAALKDFNAAIDLQLEFAAAFGQRAAVERILGKPAAADADESQPTRLGRWQSDRALRHRSVKTAWVTSSAR